MRDRIVVGIDFDNTLVTYDDVVYRVALEQGLIKQGATRSKQAIRNAIRQSPEGDGAWQAVQAVIYGDRIDEAMLIDGVSEFFGRCRARGVKVCIVSHKTVHAGQGASAVNLRVAATSWMGRHRFFDTDGLGLSPADVYFEPTREAKLSQIDRIGCTHFIDDLEETFREETFPVGVEKILYAAHGQGTSLSDVTVCSSWKEISDYLFGSDG